MSYIAKAISHEKVNKKVFIFLYNFSKKISMNFRKIHDVFLKLPVILSELLPKAIYLKQFLQNRKRFQLRKVR